MSQENVLLRLCSGLWRDCRLYRITNGLVFFFFFFFFSDSSSSGKDYTLKVIISAWTKLIYPVVDKTFRYLRKQQCGNHFLFDHKIAWEYLITELPHDKTNKMACAPSEDSDQPGHPPSLIRVFAVRMMKHWTLNYILSAQWKLWSVWADAQADLSLRWAHMSFCWFCHEVAQLVNKTMEPPALSLRTLNSS